MNAMALCVGMGVFVYACTCITTYIHHLGRFDFFNWLQPRCDL